MATDEAGTRFEARVATALYERVDKAAEVFNAPRKRGARYPLGSTSCRTVLSLGVLRVSNKRIVNVEVQRLEEGCFLATSPDLPGMVVEADTIEVLILEIFSVAGEMLEMTEGERLNPEIVYELYERGGQAKAARQPRVMAPASIFEVA